MGEWKMNKGLGKVLSCQLRFLNINDFFFFPYSGFANDSSSYTHIPAHHITYAGCFQHSEIGKGYHSDSRILTKPSSAVSLTKWMANTLNSWNSYVQFFKTNRPLWKIWRCFEFGFDWMQWKSNSLNENTQIAHWLGTSLPLYLVVWSKAYSSCVSRRICFLV